MKNYEINETEGTITYKPALDRGEDATMNISEALELVFWLKSRESDLRNMMYKASPRPIERPMQRIGDYYYGVTKQRESVRIAASRWQEVREQQADLMRRAWAFQTNERRELLRSQAHVQQLDRYGNEMYPLANEIVVKPDGTPDEVVQMHLMKLQTPEWWVIMSDNLDLGKYIKLP